MKFRATPENLATVDMLRGTTRLIDWDRNPAGMATLPSGVKIRFGLGGVLGTPDWVGQVIGTGRAIFVETKRFGGKPDLAVLDRLIKAGDYCPSDCHHAKCHLVHQELFLRRKRANGSIALFADCAADVLRALETA